jgi:hypothetical protein
LLRAASEAVAVARTERRTLEAEILVLRRQIKRANWTPVDRMNEILKAASPFFAWELDPRLPK